LSESENREEQLFQQCLDLPSGERATFLEKVCPEDAKLRERVLHLLSIYETSDDFLETDPGDGSSEVMNELQRIAPSDEASGDRIGRYRLLEIIGEGAWGSVWLAEQVEDVERRVALKILKLGLDTKEFLARFEAERQMLAMMDHPNIAKMLDAGATKLGRPYFVMELVKGVPLVEYADRERLSIEDRVNLFSQVCLGVQHAHAKGIIHRDLKPSNILVAVQDDQPVAKIIDFGIAKTTQFRLANKTLFTAYNSFLGTPVYSSPEQVSGAGQEVDHRSDTYSLGALLHAGDVLALVAGGYLQATERGCGRVEVEKLNQRVAYSGFLAGHFNNERNSCGRVPQTNLRPEIVFSQMITVVACEDDDGLVCQTGFFECVNDLTYLCIQVSDGRIVAAQQLFLASNIHLHALASFVVDAWCGNIIPVAGNLRRKYHLVIGLKGWVIAGGGN